MLFPIASPFIFSKIPLLEKDKVISLSSINYMNNGANTRATIVISFISIFMEGPEVSLYGSPTCLLQRRLYEPHYPYLHELRLLYIFLHYPRLPPSSPFE